MRSWSGRGTGSRRKVLRRFRAFAFRLSGSRNCASWRLSVMFSPALIRTWVLAQLDAARSPEDYAQRWERDVRATAEQLRKLLDERPGAPGAEVS
jgi:hypothetical protein